MKTNSANFKIALAFGAAVVLTIFITRPVVSQETDKKESHKTITLKIVSDDNGKTTVIDTVMELPDSGMVDSMKHEIEKVIELSKDGKHACVRVRKMPAGFNYDFDFPCLPECPMALKELEEFDWEGFEPGRDIEEDVWEEMAPGPQHRIIRSGRNMQTLNDVLGDIPMDRVLSYSIKDRKNGKRIVIDLDDAPMFERQNKVVIIREPGRMHRYGKQPQRKMKVYMNTGEDGQMDKNAEIPATPDAPPPPPPPPGKK